MIPTHLGIVRRADQRRDREAQFGSRDVELPPTVEDLPDGARDENEQDHNDDEGDGAEADRGQPRVELQRLHAGLRRAEQGRVEAERIARLPRRSARLDRPADRIKEVDAALELHEAVDEGGCNISQIADA